MEDSTWIPSDAIDSANVKFIQLDQCRQDRDSLERRIQLHEKQDQDNARIQLHQQTRIQALQTAQGADAIMLHEKDRTLARKGREAWAWRILAAIATAIAIAK